MRTITISISIFLLFLIIGFAVLGTNSNSTPTKEKLANYEASLANTSIKSFANEPYNYESDFQKFDFYEPENRTEKSLPLVLILHSGAFISGDKRDLEIVELSEYLASNNFTVASINYQLIPKPDDLEFLKNMLRIRKFWKEKIFATNQDLSSAVRYFREKASNFKIDPNRIFLLGYSSGAIISLNTTFLDAKDFTTYFNIEEECLHCKGGYLTDFKVKGVISIGGAMFDPLAIDNRDKTPVLFIHGEKDEIVSINKAKPFLKYEKGNIAQISKELSLTKQETNGKKAAWVFEFPEYLGIPQMFVKTLRNHIFPTLHGPNILMRRMKRNNISCQLISIKNGRHDMFYDEKGNESQHIRKIRTEILTFLKKNI